MQLGPVMALLSGPTVGNAIADPGNAIAKLVEKSKDDSSLIESVFYRILSRPPNQIEIKTALKVFNSGITADHAKLEQSLADHLKNRDPALDTAEKKQAADTEAMRAAIVKHEKAIKPKVDAAEQKRKNQITQLEEEKKSYEAALPTTIETWEKGLVGGTPWTALEPKDLKSTNGATLKVEPDQAIFVSGTNGKTTYTLQADTKLKSITAVRLEMLADDRLPGKGPGLGNGNFVLGEIELEIAPARDPQKFSRVKFSNARASFSQKSYEVAKAIDGNPGGPNAGWAISPEIGKNQTAIFNIADPVQLEGGSILRFTLKQPYDEIHTLGKFRLSVTTQNGPLPFALPADVKEALALQKDQREKTQFDAITKYFRENDATLKGLDQKLTEARKPLPIDPKLVELRGLLTALEKKPSIDPRHDRWLNDLALSKKQLSQRRLTGAQDLTWALINTSAFLFNH